jgi:hypothetical protein
MAPFPRWNDDRLDELAKRVARLDDVVTEVAVLKTEMRNLTRAVDANTRATGNVSKQFEQAQIEPFQRGRNFRNQLVLVIMGALAGGGVALGLAAVAGH